VDYICINNIIIKK